MIKRDKKTAGSSKLELLELTVHNINHELEEALMVLLVHSTHKIHYLDTAKKIYELFARSFVKPADEIHQNEITQDQMKELLECAAQNICFMINAYASGTQEQVVKQKNIAELFEFLHAKGVSDKFFLERITEAKPKFRAICTTDKKNTKTIKFLGEQVFLEHKGLDYVYLDPEANIINKFLVGQKIEIEEIQSFLTMSPAVKGLKYQKGYIKARGWKNLESTIDLCFSNLADTPFIVNFLNATNKAGIILTKSLYIQNRALDYFYRNKNDSLDILQGVLDDINTNIEQIKSQKGFKEDQLAQDMVTKALHWSALAYSMLDKDEAAIQAELARSKISGVPLNLVRMLSYIYVMNNPNEDKVVSYIEELVATSVLDVTSEFQQKLLLWFKQTFAMIMSNDYTLFADYKLIKDDLDGTTKDNNADLNDAINMIFNLAHLDFYISEHDTDKAIELMKDLIHEPKIPQSIKQTFTIPLYRLSLDPTALERIKPFVDEWEVKAEDYITNAIMSDIYRELSTISLYRDECFSNACRYLNIANQNFCDSQKYSTQTIERTEKLLYSNKLMIIKSLEYGFDYSIYRHYLLVIAAGSGLGLLEFVDFLKEIENELGISIIQRHTINLHQAQEDDGEEIALKSDETSNQGTSTLARIQQQNTKDLIPENLMEEPTLFAASAIEDQRSHKRPLEWDVPKIEPAPKSIGQKLHEYYQKLKKAKATLEHISTEGNWGSYTAKTEGVVEVEEGIYVVLGSKLLRKIAKNPDLQERWQQILEEKGIAKRFEGADGIKFIKILVNGKVQKLPELKCVGMDTRAIGNKILEDIFGNKLIIFDEILNHSQVEKLVHKGSGPQEEIIYLLKQDENNEYGSADYNVDFVESLPHWPDDLECLELGLAL